MVNWKQKRVTKDTRSERFSNRQLIFCISGMNGESTRSLYFQYLEIFFVASSHHVLTNPSMISSNLSTSIETLLEQFCDIMIGLLLPEKALVERAFELRAELENAASDVSNLFAKIGLYPDLIESE